MERKIIHVDMDAFFAAIEQRDDPSLRSKPVVVGGDPDSRGVVAAASYEARAYGIHSAMPSSQARRRCPQVVFVRPNHETYREVSTQVMALLREYTPVIEPLSVDEAFLDVTSSVGLFGSARRIGEQIRGRIRETLQLTASVGIAPNKFLAKLASEGAKPDGLLEVKPEEVLTFLAALPVERIWGVGETRAAKLRRLGFTTIGQLQQCPAEELVAQFGKQGEELYKLARGFDESAVQPGRERKSVSHEETFAEDTNDMVFLGAILLQLSEQVGRRLRAQELKGCTITLKLRYADFRTITRSKTLPQPTDSDKQIYESARALLAAVGLGGRKVRLLGVGVSNFDVGEQLRLLAEDSAEASAVERAVDEVRERFGPQSVRRARLVDGGTAEEGRRQRVEPDSDGPQRKAVQDGNNQ